MLYQNIITKLIFIVLMLINLMNTVFQLQIMDGVLNIQVGKYHFMKKKYIVYIIENLDFQI